MAGSWTKYASPDCRWLTKNDLISHVRSGSLVRRGNSGEVGLRRHNQATSQENGFYVGEVGTKSLWVFSTSFGPQTLG